ncbi:POK6 protein, partial [Mohoua ochrocephala]|nr:POK6 protein [Mohoua ochrocephala]
PWKYLGFPLFEQQIVPQPTVLQTSIKTLNDLQKLLGTLNWLRLTLGISTKELSPLV